MPAATAAAKAAEAAMQTGFGCVSRASSRARDAASSGLPAASIPIGLTRMRAPFDWLSARGRPRPPQGVQTVSRGAAHVEGARRTQGKIGVRHRGHIKTSGRQDRTCKGKRHFTVVRRLACQQIPGASCPEFRHAVGVLTIDLIGDLELDRRPEGISGKLPQQRAMRPTKGVDARGPPHRPGAMTLHAGAMPGTAQTHLFDDLGPAAHAAAIAHAGIVADGLPVQLNHAAAHRRQERMSARDVVSVEPMGQADRGVNLAGRRQGQAIGDAGNGQNRRRSEPLVMCRGEIRRVLVHAQDRVGAVPRFEHRSHLRPLGGPPVTRCRNA